MLAIAKTFENQGNDNRAREIYEQLLVEQPNLVAARQRLDSLLAARQSPKSAHRSHAPIIAKLDAEFFELPLPVAHPTSLKSTAPVAMPNRTTAVRERADDSIALTSGEVESSFPILPAESLSPGKTGLPTQLQPLFGPFQEEMLEYARAHRGEIQEELLEIVSDPAANPLHRSRAIFLLGQLGPDASTAVRGLRRTMHSVPEKSLQIELAESILLIQPGDPDAVQLLISILHDDRSEDTRFYAAFALRTSASPTTAYVVDELLMVLSETNDNRLRRMTMLSLGAFGSAAEKAIPVLKVALESPDSMTRVIADASLKAIASGSQ